jgi:membrane protein YdbS with pleckstrin-like domain
MNNSRYPSKIDTSIVAILVVGIGFALTQCWMLRAVAPKISLAVCGVFIFIVMIALIFSVPCRYILETDHLLIQSGVMRRRVVYADITAIEHSTDPRSAPALSLRRVKVSYGSAFQLVSPRDREGFMHALRARVSMAHASEA